MGKGELMGDEKGPSEPYKEEINSLLGLVRITLYILAAIAGVGISANQVGLMP